MSAVPGTITVSAVVVHRHDGAVALVRKRGTDSFMFPGGKPEPGESPREAAVRELLEETGIRVAPEHLQYQGSRLTSAANEPGWDLHAEVFVLPAPAWAGQELRVRAEIEEQTWVIPGTKTAPGITLAPLSREVLSASE
ncbi:NUDIX hydrolase [Citricoccus sp. NR2]|uniref:NUDIX hydrolase n=1 Tax=Citricoccus sp. NR2 TaxID=3004095 RepID=UPI0022DCFE02|nr:NUDIX domain-containing protein [Citricoccus sp. NR2]WBL20021.1 NUDIX domain-containing protein [Citricoccus sp. NR2]